MKKPQRWFTSDTHYGHGRVIGHAGRPFASVDEMDEALIDNYRRCVRPGDLVYHLGDLSFHKGQKTIEILRRRPGQKFLITGNHCRITPEIAEHFVWVRPLDEIKVDAQRIVLCHYAMRVWNRSHRGSWMLYGHSHGNLKDDPRARSMDVGVDAVARMLANARGSIGEPDPEDYRPISFDEVAAHMATKTWEPVDHHGMDAEGPNCD